MPETIEAVNSVLSRPLVRRPCQGEVVSWSALVDLAEADIADGNIIACGYLPAGCVMVDLIVHTDKLDQLIDNDPDPDDPPTLTVDVGFDGGDEMVDGDVTAQEGGVIRPSIVGAFRIGPDADDRLVTIKLINPLVPTAGSIGMEFFYRNSRFAA
jgi:hypothetical protein